MLQFVVVFAYPGMHAAAHGGHADSHEQSCDQHDYVPLPVMALQEYISGGCPRHEPPCRYSTHPHCRHWRCSCSPMMRTMPAASWRAALATHRSGGSDFKTLCARRPSSTALSGRSQVRFYCNSTACAALHLHHVSSTHLASGSAGHLALLARVCSHPGTLSGGVLQSLHVLHHCFSSCCPSAHAERALPARPTFSNVHTRSDVWWEAVGKQMLS